MNIRKLLLFLFVLFTGSIVQASLQSLDFIEVRRSGGFGSPAMINASRISPAGDSLSFEEKSELVNSKHLFKLHTLDLSGQGIDDGFIHDFCINKCFARIINIDLSDNPSVTNQALLYLLESPLGSVRDLPQVSGRYGCASTIIYVRARNTGITTRNIDPLFGFHIDYKHPVIDIATNSPTDEAVKILDITL